MNDEIVKTLEDIERHKTGAFAFKASPYPLISCQGMLLNVMRVNINAIGNNCENFNFSWIVDRKNTCKENVNLIVGKKSNNDDNPPKFFLFKDNEEILSHKTADFINISIEAFDNNCKITKNDDINNKVFVIGINFINLDGEYLSSHIISNDDELKKYVQIVDKINAWRSIL